MKRIIFLVGGFLSAGLLFSVSAHADSIEIPYKNLYSHLNKIHKADTDLLQFSFGFLKVPEKQHLCKITSAHIHTDKQDIPVAVTPESRFTVPFEKALKLADAVVRLEVREQSNQCDMSVQLETVSSQLLSRYSQTQLQTLVSQYKNFFNEMGGFMSFMMPQVTGLQIQFADASLSQPVSDDLSIIMGILRLPSEDIATLNSLELPFKPLRITALTSK
jgi:hypothetical protein